MLTFPVPGASEAAREGGGDGVTDAGGPRQRLAPAPLVVRGHPAIAEGRRRRLP